MRWLLRLLFPLVLAEITVRVVLWGVPGAVDRVEGACGCDVGRQVRWYTTRWSWLFPREDDHDPVLGWMHGTGVDGVNEAGFRDGEPLDPAPRGPRLVLLGDSFTWGHGLAVSDSLGPLLEARLPGVDVVNLAVSGFAHDQMVLRYEQEARRLDADLVLLVFVTTDISRNASRFQVFAKPWLDDDGRVQGVPVPTRLQVATTLGLRPRLFDLARVWVDVLFEDQDARIAEEARATRVALDRLVDATAGTELAVLGLPTPRDLDAHLGRRPPSAHADLLTSWCAPREIPCTDLRARVWPRVDDADAFRQGTHWSASATARMADLIAEDLDDHPALQVADPSSDQHRRR